MRCHIIEGGWPRDEQCASKASQWVSSGGTAGSQTYQPPCLVLFIPFHKTSLSCILSRNHCGLVNENVSRVRSGSRVGTYSYLVSERGQTVLDRASGIFCWFAALLPWSFSVHINTELLGWELWGEHGDIWGKLEGGRKEKRKASTKFRGWMSRKRHLETVYRYLRKYNLSQCFPVSGVTLQFSYLNFTVVWLQHLTL